jgi:hypothetical protein
MKKTIIFSLVILGFLFGITMNSFAQWQSDVRLTNDPQLSLTSFGNARCIAANGDVIHVVWYSGDSVSYGSWDIFYKRSTDKGLTWSAAVNLSNADSVRYNPAIAVSGSYVHVVWYDHRDGNHEEYYIRSTDGGITWGPVTRLTDNVAVSAHCSIAASGLNVHLVWYDGRDGNNEIYYKRSVDGGGNWSADTRLSNTARQSFMPAVAVSGSVVHVAWYDSTPGNYEIYYKRSIDGGVTWGADKRITNTPTSSLSPTLAVSGSIVHLVWCEADVSPYYGHIYYNRSTNGGSSWGTNTCMIRSNYNNGYPSLAVNGSVVHLVFQRLVTTSWDIVYTVSNNNGVTWSKKELQLTNNPSASSAPSIAVSGSSLHIIFRDDRDGNYEIYYKRYIDPPKGNHAGITNINPDIPNKYSLSQNYPNPFNPTTNVQFSIVNVQYVTLKVLDVLGREVATLVNELLQPGTYKVQFNGSNLSSGVYYYKLQAGEFTDVKRMMLIK